MIEVIQNIIDLCMIPINNFFEISIDLIPGVNVSLGELIIGFLVVILTVYLLFNGFGIISKGDDN